MPRMAPSDLAVCGECDHVQRVPVLTAGHAAHCARCHAVLRRRVRSDPATVLAIVVTGLVCVGLMNTFPLVALDIRDETRTTTLAGAALALAQTGRAPLGFLVFMTTVLTPALELLAFGWLVSFVVFPRVGPRALRVLALLDGIRPWSMVEVLMLGALVAFTKLQDLADVVPGVALFAAAAFILCVAYLRYVAKHAALARLQTGPGG